MMAAPLLPSAQKPGQEHDLLLAAARNAADPAFRESDLEIFAILSRQAAIALENARLHAELRAYLRQVEESQKALIKAEKLAIAGRLTASIAHEINNPLQAVQNCLHLAGRMELAEADRQNYIQMAQAELERLMNTVHRMLDYYRPGAVDRQTVDVNALIRRVLSLLEKQLADHRIQVEWSLTEELPAVWAVSDQIQQVLLNLILNAVEAMPSGGTLSIRTDIQTRLPAGSEPLQVEVMVEDSGPGVEKSRQGRVFEPFISSKEGGTGLGLAISEGIVAAHGGSLDLVQGRGRGACFRIILPAEAGSPKQEV
jgi:two-component system NtrC family sensor kinase